MVRVEHFVAEKKGSASLSKARDSCCGRRLLLVIDILRRCGPTVAVATPNIVRMMPAVAIGVGAPSLALSRHLMTISGNLPGIPA